MVKAVRLIVGPMYNCHSQHAASVRSLAETVNFCLQAAKGDWIATLQQTCSALQDPSLLGDIGFDMSPSAKRSKPPEQGPVILQERQLAERRMALVVSLLWTRGSSMSWHTDTWPGLLALLNSPSEEDKVACIEELNRDHCILLTCHTKVVGSVFYRNLCKVSPLAAKPMSEIRDLLTLTQPWMTPADRLALEAFSNKVFSSWGQTKVVEES
jgi:hypothetical protein